MCIYMALQFTVHMTIVYSSLVAGVARRAYNHNVMLNNIKLVVVTYLNT